jgi:ribonuclease BN (tRNA processing enzyme)
MWSDEYRTLADRTKHSTGRDAGRAAAALGCELLVLTHIYPPMIGREDQILLEARGEYAGNIMLPHDGTVLVV